MHLSSYKTTLKFLDLYNIKKNIVLEVGSKDVGDSNTASNFRSHIKKEDKYIGIDLTAGKNVDIIQKDPYLIPIDDKSIDIVLSTSVFEHCEFFWLTTNEIFRVLKDDGLFYFNAPSNGAFHKYPVDCYRFYPDSANAIKKWGIRSGYKDLICLESFTLKKSGSIWNDYNAVFLKNKKYIYNYPKRIIDNQTDFYNAYKNDNFENCINFQMYTEDQRLRGLLGLLYFRFSELFTLKVFHEIIIHVKKFFKRKV